MLVPIPPSSYTTPRPRRSLLPMVLPVLLLVLFLGGGVMMLTGGRSGTSTPVELVRRSTWHSAMVTAQTTPRARSSVQAQNDIERLALAAAQEFGITDTLALAVMEQESGGNPSAVSPVGARGVFQVMPATGAGIAEDLQVAAYTPAMLDDPAINTRFGMYYLNKQLARFGLSWGLAAYNWGPSNVGAFLVENPAARTMAWDAVRQQYGWVIPGETQRYVTNILAIRARREQALAALATKSTAAPTVAVVPAAPATSIIVLPVHRTQGGLTLTVRSIVRANTVVTVSLRLDNAGAALAVAPSMLRVSTETGQAYTLPSTWGTQTIPERGGLDVQLVCAPVLVDTASLVVTAQVGSEAPIAITVPRGL